MRPALFLVAVAAIAAGCGGSKTGTHRTLVIAVDAPFTGTAYVGQTIARGVQLAADQIDANGGLVTRHGTFTLKVSRYDNALSPRQAVSNIRSAVAAGAVAIVDDGTGVDAGWRIAERRGVPIGITYDGGGGLVDIATRRNVFRIAPTDHGIAFRFAEYLIPKRLKVALLHDDTTYGQQGAAALHNAFGSEPNSVAIDLELPARQDDLSPQILRARRAGATALLVWGQATTIAHALTSARSSGWNVPVYAPPSAEDPALRQLLSNRPSWLDGLTFASGRMTAELGPQSFEAFEQTFEAQFGAQRVGVRTRTGRPVIAPPDYAMYSYDFVNVLAAAIVHAAGDTSKLVRALEQVSAHGANGDQRGFNENSHEGVVDDDVFFARFEDMTFRPVKDDPLSSTLPTIPQTA